MPIDRKLHKIRTTTIFNDEYYGEDYEEPWVSYNEENDKIKFNKKGVDQELTFEIISGGTIYWITYDTANTYNKVIEYKKNDDDWVSVTATTGTGYAISVDDGDILKFRGDLGNSRGQNKFGNSTGTYFNLAGNINSYAYKETYATNLEMPNNNSCFAQLFKSCGVVHTKDLILPATTLQIYCYDGMFSGCTSLVDCPQIWAENANNNSCKEMFRGCTSLKTPMESLFKANGTIGNSVCLNMFLDCVNLEYCPKLPAKAIGDNAYQGMFQRCAKLKTTTELPATSIGFASYLSMYEGCTGLTSMKEISASGNGARACCARMFYNCSSLATAIPEFHFSSIGQSSFDNTFYGCTSLMHAPNFVATAITGSYACGQMFFGCTSLITPPRLPMATLNETCYMGMFQGCASLKSTPELPAMDVPYRAYRSMFHGCTSLTTPPELPATGLTNSSYEYMFTECRGLRYSPELPAQVIDYNTYNGMFLNCVSLYSAGTIYFTGATGNGQGCGNMFMGCTSLLKMPEIRAVQLAGGDFYRAFRGCSNLRETCSALTANVVDTCYKEMFEYCSSLKKAPELPSETVAAGCYQSMFEGCTSLTMGPELPARTLVSTCYRNIFSQCTSLNYIKCLATDISATDCTKGMSYRVASSGTFVKDWNATWPSGDDGIPTNWNVHDDYSSNPGGGGGLA